MKTFLVLSIVVILEAICETIHESFYEDKFFTDNTIIQSVNVRKIF